MEENILLPIGAALQSMPGEEPERTTTNSTAPNTTTVNTTSDPAALYNATAPASIGADDDDLPF